MTSGSAYREAAEAGWRWTLRQVGWDEEGPWIPVSEGGEPPTESLWRDSLYEGTAGLAHVLAEIRLARSWTVEEEHLADGVVERLASQVSARQGAALFWGLGSDLVALAALGAPNDAVLDRMRAVRLPHGWQEEWSGGRFGPGATFNDVLGGTAGTLLTAVYADAEDLAAFAADTLVAEAEEGPSWPAAPRRYLSEPMPDMPNFSHGTAGVCASLAVGGAFLERPDLVELARRGAEVLIARADTADGGFRLQRSDPLREGWEPYTHTWCHGGAGTSLMFAALARAGVGEVAGVDPSTWRSRCLSTVMDSGLPARLRPGFWDNDGRCCGTAGVGEVMLDAWQDTADERYLAFAGVLGDALLERAIEDEAGTKWRFVEHRNDDPLLPAGVGWMQGAAGISAFLFRLARSVEGDTTILALRRPENQMAGRSE